MSSFYICAWIHLSDVLWMSWNFKSLPTVFARLNIKENIRDPHCWPFVRKSMSLPRTTLPKVQTIMHKAFLCHDAIVLHVCCWLYMVTSWLTCGNGLLLDPHQPLTDTNAAFLFDLYQNVFLLIPNHRSGNVVILTKFLSLSALATVTVILRTSGVVSDENFIKMIMFLFQWIDS